VKPIFSRFRLSTNASINLTELFSLTYFSSVSGKSRVWSLFRPSTCSLMARRLLLLSFVALFKQSRFKVNGYATGGRLFTQSLLEASSRPGR